MDIEKKVANLEHELKSGKSAHSIAARYHIPVGEVIALQQALADDVKLNAPDHRVLIRQAFRDAVPESLKTLREFAKNGVMEGEEKAAAIQVKAADSILKYATKFVEEDVLRSWYEKPSAATQQKTIFDFGVRVDDTGATRHYIETRKAIENTVENKIENTVENTAENTVENTVKNNPYDMSDITDEGLEE